MMETPQFENESFDSEIPLKCEEVEGNDAQITAGNSNENFGEELGDMNLGNDLMMEDIVENIARGPTPEGRNNCEIASSTGRNITTNDELTDGPSHEASWE